MLNSVAYRPVQYNRPVNKSQSAAKPSFGNGIRKISPDIPGEFTKFINLMDKASGIRLYKVPNSNGSAHKAHFYENGNYLKNIVIDGKKIEYDENYVKGGSPIAMQRVLTQIPIKSDSLEVYNADSKVLEKTYKYNLEQGMFEEIKPKE